MKMMYAWWLFRWDVAEYNHLLVRVLIWVIHVWQWHWLISSQYSTECWTLCSIPQFHSWYSWGFLVIQSCVFCVVWLFVILLTHKNVIQWISYSQSEVLWKWGKELWVSCFRNFMSDWFASRLYFMCLFNAECYVVLTVSLMMNEDVHYTWSDCEVCIW